VLYSQEKLSFKKWTTKALIILAILMTLIISFLYITDTYSIRNSQPNECFSIPNQKYLSTQYILNHKNKYNTFIFGSSRVGHINPSLIKNSKTYNMSYGEGIPHEHLLILKLFIKNNIKIKNLIIGLDEFSYIVSFTNHQMSFRGKSHYLATNESLSSFYGFYFLRKPNSQDIENFKRKFLHKAYNDDINRACQFIFKQNQFFHNKIFPKKNSTTKYILPTSPISTFYNKEIFNNTLKDIQEITEIAKQNNINLILFINPISMQKYAYTNEELLFKFKEELAKITDFYDFSTQTDISRDSRYWLDAFHYTLDIGDLIIKTIYNNKVYVKNFGIHVKKQEYR